jgi:succinate dehydrogenase / fumarate reductase cytochrome b subunit
MPAIARPLSPHLSVYRWQIQMVASMLHRATGSALAFGTILLCMALIALASGPEAFAKVREFCGSWLGLVLLFGWSWAFSFHLLNGIRHLLQDIGMGFTIPQFVRNGWLATIGSFVLTALIWACVVIQGAAA